MKPQPLNSKGPMCFKCGEVGHIYTGCSFKTKSARSLSRCFKCDKVSHLLRKFKSSVKAAVAMASDGEVQEPKREVCALCAMIITARCSHGDQVDVPVTKGNVGDYVIDTLRDTRPAE